MVHPKEKRWKQRFQNLQKAYLQFKEEVELNRQKSLSKLEKEGIIQRFEHTFELSWKTLKDYLEAQGEKTLFPINVIKKLSNTK